MIKHKIESTEAFIKLTEKKGGIYITEKDDIEFHVMCSISIKIEHFKDLTLSNITFEDDFILQGGRIENCVQIAKCTFKKRFIFGVVCEKGFWARGVVFNSYTSFVNGVFKESFHLTGVSNFGPLIFTQGKYDSFGIFESNLSHYLDFSKAEIEYINIKNVTFEKALSFTDVHIKAGAREAMRILKDQAHKYNDKIAAVDFYQKEMIALESELCSSKGKYSELFVIFMNRISNNHGLSWLRAICFTLLSGFIFFTLFLLCLDEPYYSFEWKGIEQFIEVHSMTFRYFIEFINPAHKISYMDNFSPSGWSFIFDLLGRISIGYGVYQALTSFRKYGFK